MQMQKSCQYSAEKEIFHFFYASNLETPWNFPRKKAQK